ncbi:ThuA domain-containing protein [Jiella avicenniae]|uniref:ThuA domain-containing protein n=1 Tax=Jiella avicenniae TaxID=2907202 RepID=A0A9X1TD51_9HYPH|nr:ThuA domain-containing protein [Jiella avicenniae]MCE7029683.1 ThuA domain-containing protein [Jiella avicenniae]
MIRVTIWNEFRDEKVEAEAAELYPDGMHPVLASIFAGDERFSVRTATLDEPEAGLGGSVLDETDVLLWWGHKHHDEVPDELARRVQSRVLEGMGLIALHSAHFSKPFKLLMGTHCSLRWRRIGERERVWNLAPSHPITAGIGDYFELDASEMYGERFDIPEPDQTIFISWFAGGEVFRSGCAWQRGNGRVFYFSPGDQAYPIYYDETVRRVILNASEWCAARVRIPFAVPNIKDPIEPVT